MEKRLSKKLKLDDQQTKGLRVYLSVNFEAKKMMKETSKRI